MDEGLRLQVESLVEKTALVAELIEHRLGTDHPNTKLVREAQANLERLHQNSERPSNAGAA